MSNFYRNSYVNFLTKFKLLKMKWNTDLKMLVANCATDACALTGVPAPTGGRFAKLPQTGGRDRRCGEGEKRYLLCCYYRPDDCLAISLGYPPPDVEMRSS